MNGLTNLFLNFDLPNFSLFNNINSITNKIINICISKLKISKLCSNSYTSKIRYGNRENNPHRIKYEKNIMFFV